jgi:DNA-binding NarL/FixJ family response regulator
MRARKTVLVVDDEANFRAFAGAILERAGLAVELAADGEEALQSIARAEPDLVLLDVCLPRTSGYEIHRQLRERYGESLPVIFVSGVRVDAYDRVAGLLLGADDYLAKPFDPDELVARVRRSLQRTRWAPEVESDAAELLAELTPREREVLSLLASGRSAKQVARQLVISPRTLGTHVQNILRKLGVHTRTQAVAIAHRAGLAPALGAGREHVGAA